MGKTVEMAAKGGDLGQNKYTITFYVHFPKRFVFTYTSSV